MGLARIARRRGLLFFVGGDARTAAVLGAALGADGLHLPQRDSARRGVNMALRRRFWLSAAAHDQPAVRRARLAGIQALVVSPIFPSASPSAGRPKGSLAFARLARSTGVPTFALGGIDADTVRRLNGSGAAGVAGVSLFEDGR